MEDHDWLAKQFEENRPHLRAVAYRMLGSLSEADDAVQEAWFRLSRSDTSGIENLGGWLTTVVGHASSSPVPRRRAAADLGTGFGEGMTREEIVAGMREQTILKRLASLAELVLAPSTLSLIRNMFLDPQQRAFAIGVWATSFSAGERRSSRGQPATTRSKCAPLLPS